VKHDARAPRYSGVAHCMDFGRADSSRRGLPIIMVEKFLPNSPFALKLRGARTDAVMEKE
jgi:hypothetical protein